MFGLGLPELIVVLIIFTPAVVGALIAKAKGRNVFGWFLFCGSLWFPLIILLSLPPTTEVEGKYRECPKCKEIINWHASFCKHCKNNIGDVEKKNIFLTFLRGLLMVVAGNVSGYYQLPLGF